VARRQLREAGINPISTEKLTTYLFLALDALARNFGCERKDLRLDHQPALALRDKIIREGIHVGYLPDANDSDHLIYRTHTAHLVKTNHSGDHGQHPDRVLIKKARRLTENKPPKRKVKIKSRGFDKVSRPFKKRSKK
jgi:hypothetical protein